MPPLTGAIPDGRWPARGRRGAEVGLLPELVVEAAREAVLAAAAQDARGLLLDRAAEVGLGLPDPALAHPLDHVAGRVGPEAVEVGVGSGQGLGAGRVARDVAAKVAPGRPARA